MKCLSKLFNAHACVCLCLTPRALKLYTCTRPPPQAVVWLLWWRRGGSAGIGPNRGCPSGTSQRRGQAVAGSLSLPEPVWDWGTALHQLGFRRYKRGKMTRVLFSPAQLLHFVCHSEQSEEIALILCVIGWIMIPVFCKGDVAAVGALGGFRIGKGSGGIVTTEKRRKILESTST